MPCPAAASHSQRPQRRGCRRLAQGLVTNFKNPSANTLTLPTFAASGRDDEAVADLRKAAELCPEAAGQADALSDIAKIYQKLKDHRRAEAELKARP